MTVSARAGVAEGDRVADPSHAFEPECFAGGLGEVEGSPFDVGTAVDDAGDEGVAVVDELDRGPTRQRLVSDAKRAAMQSRAACRLVAPEPGPVPAGTAVAEGAEGEVAAGGAGGARGAAGSRFRTGRSTGHQGQHGRQDHGPAQGGLSDRRHLFGDAYGVS